MKIEHKAIRYAIIAHGNQMYGKHPYAFHLAETMAVAMSYGLSNVIVAACWLHDVIEDTSTTLEDLQNEFGFEISEIVRCVTDEPGKNRKERKANTYAKTATNPDAVLVKLCDRIANLDECIRSQNSGLFDMYKKENNDFFKGLDILARGGVFFTMGMAILKRLEYRFEQAELFTPENLETR